LTAIGRSGLQGLTGMTEADLNAGVVNVINYGRRTFRNNTHVTEFVLPSAVTLANQVFQGCSALTSIVLGPNVTSINADMFGGFTTTGLTSLELQVLDPASIDNVPTGDFSATTLTVPAGSLALYQASAWGSAGFLDIVAAPILSTNAVDNELDFNLYPNLASGSVIFQVQAMQISMLLYMMF